MPHSPFYITTPIYYVNDVPHLGHAYTTIVADMFARFHRARGDETWMLTGTDEHGQKVEEAAKKRGLTARQLCDEVGPRFVEMWKTLGIANDDFIRTTEPRHETIVQKLWHRIHERGDLYLETYQGWYCVGCEEFYTESQLDHVDDTWKCRVHKTPVSFVDKERSWFFRLSKYAEPLLAYFEKHPDFIQPENYRNEIISFVRGGLKDLSVSRTSFAWGIPVPDPDPQGLAHVMYVWFDALTNYYSALCDDGELTGPRVEKFWTEAVHLIGKDILRFHTVYWPAFLLAANLPMPRMIRVHGWWTVGGEKISKSMPATRVDPVKLATALGDASTFGFAVGNDAMRYYLMREMPLGNDGNFTFESLLGRYNADLANDLGNLINRSLTMIIKFRDQAPAQHDPVAAGAHAELATAARTAIDDATALLEGMHPSRALDAIWRFIGVANRYIDQTKPWELAKAKSTELPHTVWALGASLWVIARLIAPVMPTTSRLVREWLGDREDGWPDGLAACPPLTVVMAPAPLFPRLDAAAQAAVIDKVVAPEFRASATPAPAAAAVPAVPPIEFADFEKLELRVGTVLAAVKVAKADKLLHLTVDLGEAQPRSIVSGIAARYTPEAMVGKQVVVVANLAPRKMKGIVSQGMILAAGDDAILGLSTIDEAVPPGSRVR